MSADAWLALRRCGGAPRLEEYVCSSAAYEDYFAQLSAGEFTPGQSPLKLLDRTMNTQRRA